MTTNIQYNDVPPVSPTSGDMFYNTNSNIHYVYSGTTANPDPTWIQIQPPEPQQYGVINTSNDEQIRFLLNEITELLRYHSGNAAIRERIDQIKILLDSHMWLYANTITFGEFAAPHGEKDENHLPDDLFEI